MALMIRAGVLAGALFGITILAGAPAAAAPLVADPALGAPSSAFATGPFSQAADSAEWGCRRYCGWGGRRGWRRDRIDAGDVLIGAAVIGGVIAIANSQRRREREREVVVIDRDPRYRDRDAERDRPDDRRTGSAGLDSAVDMCLARIERDVRVDTVDTVERTASGWQVTGSIFNGAQFRCRIGNSGQIDTIDYDGTFGAGDWRDPQASADRPAAGQWDEQSYAAARAGLGGTVRPDMAVQEAEMRGDVAVVPARAATTGAMPAYPGGPIPGEVIPETLEEVTGG